MFYYLQGMCSFLLLYTCILGCLLKLNLQKYSSVLISLFLLFHKKLGVFLEICINQRNSLLTGYIPEVFCFVSGLSGSRYRMEYTIDKCSELDQNIDLSSLNLTALYNCHYLSCVHTVDLSNNNLSSCSLPQLHPLQRCRVCGTMLPEA